MTRMYHLDALRSFCMLYGVFFHAHEVSSFWFSDFIATTSGYFRMSTFFFVSALLTTLLFERRTVVGTIRARLVVLGVPLIFSFLTLVPLAKWAQTSLALLPGDAANLPDVFWDTITFQFTGAYMHLWFLIALLVYLLSAPTAYVLLRKILVWQWVQKFAMLVPARLQVLLLAVLVGMGCASSMTIFYAVLPERTHSNFLANNLFFNYPFYLMGLAAYVSYKDFQNIIRLDRLAIVACLVVVVALRYWGDGITVVTGWFLKGLVNCVAVITMTAVFSKFFSKSGPLLNFLTKTIFSVYLVHYTFIYCFGYVFVLSGATNGLLYALTVSTSIVASLAFHYVVVEGSLIMRFLYNGCWTTSVRSRSQKVLPNLISQSSSAG